MAIKVNTALVKSTANQIAVVNKNIKNDFTSVQNAINSLNTNWDGSASEAAFRKFNDIKSKHYEKRYSVVNDMVNFMLKQVGENYERTETIISSAASAFK